METEIQVAQLNKDVEYMTEKIDEIHAKQTRMGEKLDTFIDSADNKYARKDVQNLLIGGLITVVTGGTVASIAWAINH